MGLRELNCLRLKEHEVEGDSAVVISWGKGDSLGCWCLASILFEIRVLMSLLFVSLSHIDRSQNELADKLANWGVTSGSVFSANCSPKGCL